MIRSSWRGAQELPRLYPVQSRGRPQARTAQAGRGVADDPRSGAQRAPGLVAAFAGAALIALTLAAGGAGAQEAPEPRSPAELWKAFPLDPTKGETSEQSTRGQGATTIQRRLPAPTTTASAPRQTRQTDERGFIAAPLAVTLAGLAMLVAVGVVVVIRSRRGRLLPRRPPRWRALVVGGARGAAFSVPGHALAPAWRPVDAAGTERPPRPSLPQGRSQTGSLPLLAQPEAGERAAEPANRKTVCHGDAPPQNKPLPSLGPPPEKERQLRSGLPPGKRVPRGADTPPSKEPTATLSAPQPIPPPQALRPLNRGGHVEANRPTRRMAGTRVRAEECEIECWQGYLRSDFYAFSLRPTGGTTVVARSPSFRWRSSDPPPAEGAAAEAHAALVARLSAEGWESVGTRAASWYRTRLRRRLNPTLRYFPDPRGPGTG